MSEGGIGGGMLDCTIGGGGTVDGGTLPPCDLRFGECCGTGGGGEGCMSDTCDLLVVVCWGTGGGGGAV